MSKYKIGQFILIHNELYQIRNIVFKPKKLKNYILDEVYVLKNIKTSIYNTYFCEEIDKIAKTTKAVELLYKGV